MYKVKYGLLPQSALNYTAVNDTNRIHFTRTFSYFTPISFRIGIRSKSIAGHGPRLWNSIPIAIQNSTGFGLFKRRVKDYYVNSYTCTDI